MSSQSGEVSGSSGLGDSDPEWDYTEEPHRSRRKAIIAAHPEIRQLFGRDPAFVAVVTAMVVTQTVTAYLLRESDWALVILQTYLVSATANHALTLAIHEISHNIAFGNRAVLANRLFGIFANLPLCVPISGSFKKYHPAHHRYLGVEGLDVDIPSTLEVRLFSSRPAKLLWLLLQQLIYALRPLLIAPKAPSAMEALNLAVQLAFDGLVWQFWGGKSLFYLLMGLLFLGLHPASGHFISEHYVFRDPVDTNSYLGWMNLVMFNVGYHVEHHDFPFVSCTRLPAVRALAGEFYEKLPTHRSYVKVLWEFLVSPTLGPGSRLKRKRE